MTNKAPFTKATWKKESGHDTFSKSLRAPQNALFSNG